jgi:hypothetical protein
MAHQQLSLAGLAAAIGREFSTERDDQALSALGPDCCPAARLLTGPAVAKAAAPRGGGATGVPGPSVAARAAGNGSPAAPLEPAMLKTVRRRRHATALTTHTLAEQLGLAADELDAAI